MKAKILLTVAILGFGYVCSGQNSSWDKWNWLTGEWIGEGSGKPGQGSGTFSFAFDLDRNILVRKNHTEYPATGTRPQTMHNDLMIVYPDPGGNITKAIYFDNEGHTINYTITYSEKSVTFTSDKIPNMPVFRLIYTLIDNGTVNIQFQMSQDGIKFNPYLEGISKRREQ
ncbi:MAG: hypothetical protein Q8868_08165 [Bacteroidota bacterium]|nr:hypothetical protein [Bacteroidota bacterium]